MVDDLPTGSPSGAAAPLSLVVGDQERVERVVSVRQVWTHGSRVIQRLVALPRRLVRHADVGRGIGAHQQYGNVLFSREWAERGPYRTVTRIVHGRPGSSYRRRSSVLQCGHNNEADRDDHDSYDHGRR